MNYKKMAEALELMPMPLSVTVSIRFAEGEEAKSRTTSFGMGFDAARASIGKGCDFSPEVEYAAAKEARTLMRTRALEMCGEEKS